MANGYLHGVYTREVPTEILPPRRVDTNVVIAIGTAPVHLLKEGKRKPIHEPVLCYNYTEFVDAFGWSENWDSYTLCEVADAMFAKFGMAPVIFINVFDPSTHVRESEEGTPSESDVSLVTSADILGGIDQDTLKKKGLELVDELFPRFRLIPGSIIAPKFSTDAAVAIAMAAKAKGINTLFNAMALVDIPTDTVSTYTEVSGHKEKNNLTDPNMVTCWPLVKLGDKIYHLSTQLAGCISSTDSDAGGTPHVSPSNKRAYIDGAITRDAEGTLSEVWLGLDQNNYLNGQGVHTVNNFDGGWKFWGNRTACYPSTTDPKDAFIPVRRFFNWYQNTFILTYFAKVDSPLTRRLINTFIKSEQIRLDGYTAQEVINGGRITYIEDENPLTDLIDGLLRFHLYIAPPVPARAVEGIFEFDPHYLSNLMGDD